MTFPTASTNTNTTPTNNTIPTNTNTTTTTTSTTKSITLTYSLSPMDDTFLEAWRPDEPLGLKDKLKIDADFDGVPTKVIQMKFGLGGIFDDLAGLVLLSSDDNDNDGNGGNYAEAMELLEMNNNATSSLFDNVTLDLKLNSATLRMYALSPSSFGGKVSSMKTSSSSSSSTTTNHYVDWNEETAVWSDYVRGGKNGMWPQEFLPGVNDTLSVLGDDGVKEGSWNHADVTSVAQDMFARANINGNTNNGNNDEVNTNEDNEKQMALRISTDKSDGVIYASKENPSGNFGPTLVLEFVLTGTTVVTTTTSSSSSVVAATTTAEMMTTGGGEAAEEGVEASEEGASEDILDVVLPTTTTAAPETKEEEEEEEESMVNGTDENIATNDSIETSNTDSPTASPSDANVDLPTLSPVEPMQDAASDPSLEDKSGGDIMDSTTELPDDVNEPILAEEDPNTTSVISSSFRMTITAIETNRRKRNLLQHNLRATDRKLSEEEDVGSDIVASSSHQSIQEKELPAITQHLDRVYEEVLSIAPASISLVFEDDLVVSDMNLNAGHNFDGVIRKSVFRVMAIFDDPNISNTQSDDAAKVLDQATIYAFIGPEKDEFIQILKSTGERPIVEDPAEYDVTVLKVDYTLDQLLQDAAANNNNANIENANNDASKGQVRQPEPRSSSSSTSSLGSILIGGASVLVFASSLAALLLWRQRRRSSLGGEDYHENHNLKSTDNDDLSPRSHDTVPTTPSPTVFRDRFKNKKKFDYAEFEDDSGEQYVDHDGDYADKENPSSRNNMVNSEYYGDAMISPLTTDKALIITSNNNRMKKPNHSFMHRNQPMAQDIRFSPDENVSFDDSSVSDVSAHVLGAKGNTSTSKKADLTTTIAGPNASQAESFLLDTTMESYDMEAMSALDQVRLENVLQLEDPSPPPYHANATAAVAVGGIATASNIVSVKNIEKVARHKEADGGSISTGAVPSELYSNLSIDSSMLHNNNNISYDTPSSSAIYGSHLFTSLDMMVLRNRNKDSALLEMPPPPSDAESESSSRNGNDSQDDHDLDNDLAASSSLPLPMPPAPPMHSSITNPSAVVDSSCIENASMREQNQNEQDVVSQSINDELTKVMKLLNGGGGHLAAKSEGEEAAEDLQRNYNDVSRDESCYIGNVREPAHCSEVLATATTNAGNYEGLNVLIDDNGSTSTDAETDADENDPLKLMNNTLSDCIGILEKARESHHNRTTGASPSSLSLSNLYMKNESDGYFYADADAASSGKDGGEEGNGVKDDDDELSLVTEKMG